VGHKADTLA